jgi:hypothetical protein
LEAVLEMLVKMLISYELETINTPADDAVTVHQPESHRKIINK